MRNKWKLAAILGAGLGLSGCFLEQVSIRESRPGDEVELDGPIGNLQIDPYRSHSAPSYEIHYGQEGSDGLVIWADRCESLREKGDYKRALICANRMVRKYPDSAVSYRIRATVYERRGDYKKAYRDMKMAAKRDNDPKKLTYSNELSKLEKNLPK